MVSIAHVIINVVMVLLFAGFLAMVLFHVSNFLSFPSKRRGILNAVIISSIVQGFVLLSGLLILLLPSLGKNGLLRMLIMLITLGLLLSMIKLFYQVSWRKSFNASIITVISILVISVLVGILYRVVGLVI